MRYLLPALILLPLLGAVLLLLAGERAKRWGFWVALPVSLGSLGMSAALLPGAQEEFPPVWVLSDWAGNYSIPLKLLATEPGTLFLAVSALVFFGVVLFSRSYMEDHPRAHAFWPLVLFFLAALSLFALADSVGPLLIGWEALGLISFLLIALNHEGEAERTASRSAFLHTLSGDALVLAGLAGLFGATGEATLSQMTGALTGEALASPVLAGISLVLIVVGAASKAGVFPFHGWLPPAMIAPTPVSALLHGAAMVGAGGLLVIRLGGPLNELGMASYTLLIVGWLSLLIGGIAALLQDDAKKLLAYSTTAELGGVFVALSLGSTEGALLWLLAHGPAKAALFLAVGGLEKETQSRSVRRYKQLILPLWFIAPALLGVLALSGVPPVGVAAGKLLGAEAVGGAVPVQIALALTSLLTGLYLGRLAGLVFWPTKEDDSDAGRETEPAGIFPVALLALAGALAPFALLYTGADFAGFPALGALDPLLALAGLVGGLRMTRFSPEGGFWLYLRHGLGFEGLLPVLLSRVWRGLSTGSSYLDAGIDAVVRGVGVTVLLLREAADLFERFVIDGAVRLAANSWLGVRRVIKPLQSGYAHTYLFVMITSLFILSMLGGLMTRGYLCHELAGEGSLLQGVCRSVGVRQPQTESLPPGAGTERPGQDQGPTQQRPAGPGGPQSRPGVQPGGPGSPRSPGGAGGLGGPGGGGGLGGPGGGGGGLGGPGAGGGPGPGARGPGGPGAGRGTSPRGAPGGTSPRQSGAR